MSLDNRRHKATLALAAAVGAILLLSAIGAVALPAFAPITNWTPDTALSQQRASMGVVAQADQWIYVVGGRDAMGQAVDDVWRAEIRPTGALGAWESLGPLPVRLYLHAVVASGSHIYVLGGYDDVNYRREVWRSQINSDGALTSWQRDWDLPSAVTLHAAVEANGRIYVSGGDTPQGRTNRVYVASIGENGALADWQEVAALPPASLYRHAMTATSDTLLVTGGYDGSTVRAESYSARIKPDGTLESWQASNLPGPREYHQAVIHDGRLVLIGGRESTSSPGLTRVDSALTNALEDWASEPPLPEPLYRFGAITIRKNGSDYIYVIGGLSGNSYRANVYHSAVPPATPSATPTATSSPTPTITPTGVWAAWREPVSVIWLPPSGSMSVTLDYGNVPASTSLPATLVGAAVFAKNGKQSLVDVVPKGSGAYELALKANDGARPGDPFYLTVRLGSFLLKPDPRNGLIKSVTYLPLMLRDWKAPVPTACVDLKTAVDPEEAGEVSIRTPPLCGAKYLPGDAIQILAEATGDSYQFEKWTSDPDGEFTDDTAAETYFRLGSNDVTITAHFTETESAGR